MNKYWGYKHIDGTYHVRRFICFNDIHNAYRGGECLYAVGPFPAGNTPEALRLVRQKVKVAIALA